MKDKAKRFLCIILCLLFSLSVSIVSFAGSDSGQGLAGSWYVEGILHVSTTSASATSTRVGYPDVTGTVVAKVTGYGKDSEGTLRYKTGTNSGNGSTTAACSPSGYLFSYAYAWCGNSSNSSAVSLYSKV